MEIMDVLSALAVLVVIGLALVGAYTLWLYHKVKQHFVDNMVAKMIADSESNIIGLEVEVTNGVYFCYNIDDHQFVCQGSTVQEIKQGFQLRYPNKTAYLASGEPDVVEQIKTDLMGLTQHENSTGK